MTSGYSNRCCSGTVAYVVQFSFLLLFFFKFLFYVVPHHTRGWSQLESLENTAAVERKRGVSELGNISLDGARCVQTCSRQTLADVFQLSHHGLDLKSVNRQPVSAAARLFSAYPQV